VPSGARSVAVRLDTSCNGPGAHTLGHLSCGKDSVGIINWNTCLMCPEGFPCDQIRAHLGLQLPADSHFATAHATEPADRGEATFQTVSLTELVDNP
jgi:hypothetical protein